MSAKWVVVQLQASSWGSHVGLAPPFATWLPWPAGLAGPGLHIREVRPEESVSLPFLDLNLPAETSEHSRKVQAPQPIPSFTEARLTGQHLPLPPC